MRIALIGARGAGKTSVGQLLAAQLGVAFLDTDALVEAHSGRSIRELMADGSFREREREVVADVLACTRGVVSLGGGAVLDPTFDASGWTVVWLTAEPSVLAERIRADEADRPSLTGRSAEDEVGAVLASRKDRYAALEQLTVATDTFDVGGVVESLLARFRAGGQ